MSIHEKYASKVTTQSYVDKPAIEGVEIVTSTLHSDDGGHFVELFRLNAGSLNLFTKPFEVKQVSLSSMTPGTIKAFHVHYKQDDVWFVPPSDKLLVNLHDVRTDSSTFDVHMRLTLGDGRPQLLRIPKGVAHGAANLYHRPMVLLYATSEQFSSSSPDEHRLPWDIFGESIWHVTRG